MDCVRLLNTNEGWDRHDVSVLDLHLWEDGESADTCDLLDTWQDEAGLEMWAEAYLRTTLGWHDVTVEDNHGEWEVVGLDPLTGRPAKAWLVHLLSEQELLAGMLAEALDLLVLDGVVTEDSRWLGLR